MTSRTIQSAFSDQEQRSLATLAALHASACADQVAGSDDPADLLDHIDALNACAEVARWALAGARGSLSDTAVGMLRDDLAEQADELAKRTAGNDHPEDIAFQRGYVDMIQRAIAAASTTTGVPVTDEERELLTREAIVLVGGTGADLNLVTVDSDPADVENMLGKVDDIRAVMNGLIAGRIPATEQAVRGLADLALYLRDDAREMSRAHEWRVAHVAQRLHDRVAAEVA